MRVRIPQPSIAPALALLLALGVVGTGFLSEAHAQSPSVSRSDYVNTYARPGQATHTVYVWGAVSQPGIWKIEPETGLVELFSVVQPSGYGVQTPGTRSKVRLRIHRSEGGTMEVVNELTLSKLLDLTPSQRPSLQAQDVIEVRTIEQRRFSFSTVSAVIGTLSSLTLLVIRIFDL
jgi:hypothetical protein